MTKRERDLIEALQFYADQENYQARMVWASDGGQAVAPIEDDRGRRARMALREYSKQA